MMYLTTDQKIARENLMYRLNEMLREYSSTTYKYNEYHKTWKTEKTFEQYWTKMNLLEDAIDELGCDYTEEEIRLVRIKFLSEMAN